jgi:16S rRNA (guanine527-N7)-methyltransferase
VFHELLCQKLAGILELTSEQIQTLQSHYELLLRWNRVLNLTAIDSLEEAIERHYCESLFLGVHLPLGPLQIADVGSGAGFPGIPVAVLRPDCTVTLIESHQRKAVFLREATRKLANIRVLAKRADEIEERFDRAICRAVSYEALGAVLKKLAQTADLLTGAEAPPDHLCFTWNSVRLPWGSNRYLRMGVSRETTC